MLFLMVAVAAFALARAEEVPSELTGDMVEAALVSDASDEALPSTEADAAPAKKPVVVPKEIRQPVALVAFGDVDEALMARVQAWAVENLAIAVPVFPAQPQLQLATFDDVAEAAKALLEDDRFGVVVLWRPSSEVSNHGAFFPDARVAIANLNPMFTPDTDAEKIERRVDRQVIRGISMVMGLKPSPNPHSAMFDYANLEELDQIGRNLDPPWLKNLQEIARDYGIATEKGSPYDMLQTE
jgi:hypothetical protein